MKVTDIIQTENQGDVIQEMKSHRFIPQPDVEAAKKVLDPQEHDINNPIIRPDKRVKVTDDTQGESAGKRTTICVTKWISSKKQNTTGGTDS